MKKIILSSVLMSAVVLGSFGCSKIENIDLNPGLVIKHSDEYYKNLRAYKQTDHTLAFGWFGGWTAKGATMRSRLATAPDSMDLISIWGGGKHNLSPEQIADMRFVQEKKGTKVLFTIFAHNISDILPATVLANVKENIPAYAKALADSIYKYGYDGIDLDYEAGSGSLFYDNNNLLTLIKELGKYVGPESGSDRLLVMDVASHLGSLPDIEKYLNYIIVQTYATGSYTTLDNKAVSAKNDGFSPSKLLVGEDYEKNSTTGGVVYTDRDGNKMNSVKGFAMWQPASFSTDGIKKAGFGVYHFENGYINGDGYRFIREAIQAANPAQ